MVAPLKLSAYHYNAEVVEMNDISNQTTAASI